MRHLKPWKLRKWGRLLSSTAKWSGIWENEENRNFLYNGEVGTQGILVIYLQETWFQFQTMWSSKRLVGLDRFKGILTIGTATNKLSVLQKLFTSKKKILAKEM